MPDRSFVIVAVIAFAAPFIRELLPPLGIPSIVFELVGGIIVGPQVLAIATTTPPVELFSQVGLAALLFLAGREIQVEKLRGTRLRRAVEQFAIGLLIAGAIALGLGAVDLIEKPLLIAIVLAATSLSIIIVPLRESGESRTQFGQQVIATAAIAEFGAVILLSFFFSHERPGAGTEILHLSVFLLLAVLVYLSVSRSARSARLMAAVERLRTGSTQIQVRADLALVALVVALANSLGLESILAAFTVGIIRGMTAPGDRLGEQRLDTVALGIFIPFFFVASGIDFQADQLFDSIGAAIKLPLIVAGLLAVHMLGALRYRREMDRPDVLAAGLLQATSFSFIIVATQIGLQLRIMEQSTAAALIAAGLVSVIAFPALAFRTLERDRG